MMSHATGIILCIGVPIQSGPYFTILAYLKYKKKPDKYVKVDNVTVSNMQNFKEDLRSQEISNCFSNILENDPNASYEQFNNIISTVMDKHFPIKIMKFNKYKHKKTKWITSGILNRSLRRIKCTIGWHQYVKMIHNFLY